MSRAKPGDRVGAIQKADDTTVHFYGYGTYDGDLPHAPFDDDPSITVPSPRITLDKGGIVWGSDCWWGDEQRIQKLIGDRTIIEVPGRQQAT
jgi:hypothetical protein